ncbi:hypothetical protein RF11_02864 [Thelohanellus kitauei]|uniref:Uncharacterized protein n=1 Tax=Thelohanellus kitauei TaxID=669202 RepID=A0A0C2MR97_THEKT|nr:hypothetical protein RF11_02864 [Thelohanellus kitauei]
MALLESNDICDTTHVTVFVRRINDTYDVIEELLGGGAICSKLLKYLESRTKTEYGKLVSICTDGAEGWLIDHDDPSTMVELMFMNDIPSPPMYMLMTIILKYYNITNSSLVKEEKERYNLVACQCASNNTFTFSYPKTQGLRIFRFTINQTNNIPVMFLEDLTSVCIFVLRIITNQQYDWITRDQVIKRHPVYNTRTNIMRYDNENLQDICYVHHGRRFILRMSFHSTSKRPLYPIVEVIIKISNDSREDIHSLYEYKMFGWQTRCKKHRSNSLIDYPVFIYDDSLQKSKLFEYIHKGIRTDSVFIREDFVGINDSIGIMVKNDPNYMNECKNHVSSY